VSQEDVFSTWLIPALVLAKRKRHPLGSRQNRSPHQGVYWARPRDCHSARRERLAPGFFLRTPRFSIPCFVVSQEDVFSTWLIPALVLAKWKRRPLGSRQNRGSKTSGYVKKNPARVVRGGQSGSRADGPSRLPGEDSCFVVSQEDVFSSWLIPALVLAKWKRRPLGSRQVWRWDY